MDAHESDQLPFELCQQTYEYVALQHRPLHIVGWSPVLQRGHEHDEHGKRKGYWGLKLWWVGAK
uniref:Uncharacterized protein n=1 Tax=Lotus japonicus TaxID=34305 RepID=I3T503_LOTJA|nr:unknown [Lotus japonicus]